VRPRHVRSVTHQSLHYLARPHSAIPRSPILGPAAWRGDELAVRDDWRVELSAVEADELDHALAVAAATAKPLAELRVADFPLPTLRGRIEAWIRELQEGSGVVLIRGLPVDRWTDDEAATVFWCLGLHLGRPGAQNGRGDLLGRVRDQGLSYDDPRVRGYQTTAALAPHTDFADVVGLMCLRPAASGGLSRLVSSVSVYNELLRRRPDLVDALFEPMVFDARGDAGVDWARVIPCRYDAGQLRTLYHGDYLRSAAGRDQAPELTPRERELLDLYDEIATAPGMYIEFELHAGDIELLYNHSVLHARTPYVDSEDPNAKRELLRLWLSLGIRATLRGRLERARELLRLVGEVGRAKLRTRSGGVGAHSGSKTSG
jgi:hypothetical protein